MNALQDVEPSLLGDVLSEVLRTMMQQRLADYFIGSILDADLRIAKVYFSDEVSEAALEGLRDALDSGKVAAKIQPSDEEGAAFMIVASVRSDQTGGTEVAGSVPVHVPFSGVLAVQQ